MAGSMKAKIEIGLDTSKIKSGSKEATQSFDKIASGAKSALGKVDARADKAGNKIKQVGNEGKIAGSKVKAGAEKGAQGMNKLGNEAKKAERDIGGVAISVLGLGASITGLSDTIFGMKEKLVALERSSFGLERTTEDMKRMQEDFDEAVKAGTMTAKEHARALKDLELGYKDMAVEVKEIEAETEAMNSEWISFAVNTATTVVFSLTTITTALGAERVAKIGSALATNIATLANKKFVLSLWAIARHPVFLIATAGLAIWESNLFGLRSEIEKWSGMDDLSLLSNLEKTFSSGIPEAGAETMDSLNEIEKKAEELQETFDDTTTQTNRGIIPSIEEIGKCSDKTSVKVDRLSDSIDNLKKKRNQEQKDFVANEIKFQAQVDRIRKINGSTRAVETGLLANVNYRNMINGTYGFGADSTLLRSAKGSDHWNGGSSNPIGGNASSAISNQQAYNASISGYDKDSTAGYSPQGMVALRNFKQRVAEQNARFSAEHENRKRLAKEGKQKMYDFADYWDIRMPRGTNFPKAWLRGLPQIVQKVKNRISYVKNLGYGTPTSEEALQQAEAKIKSDRDNWVLRTGLKESTVIQYHESGKMSDIYNVINHRQRLGIISSGVI